MAPPGPATFASTWPSRWQPTAIRSSPSTAVESRRYGVAEASRKKWAPTATRTARPAARVGHLPGGRRLDSPSEHAILHAESS
jgi:hypothetical protein